MEINWLTRKPILTLYSKGPSLVEWETGLFVSCLLSSPLSLSLVAQLAFWRRKTEQNQRQKALAHWGFELSEGYKTDSDLPKAQLILYDLQYSRNRL